MVLQTLHEFLTTQSCCKLTKCCCCSVSNFMMIFGPFSIVSFAFYFLFVCLSLVSYDTVYYIWFRIIVLLLNGGVAGGYSYAVLWKKRVGWWIMYYAMFVGMIVGAIFNLLHIYVGPLMAGPN